MAKKAPGVHKTPAGDIKGVKDEFKATKVLPAQVLKDTEKLIGRLETEIS